jgi:hypothetical protein
MGILKDEMSNLASSIVDFIKSSVPVKSGRLKDSVKADVTSSEGSDRIKITAEEYIDFIKEKDGIDEGIRKIITDFMATKGRDAIVRDINEELKQ